MKYNRPQATASWGTMAKDWEKGIDYDRLHKERVKRAQEAIRHAGLGAVGGDDGDRAPIERRPPLRGGEQRITGDARGTPPRIDSSKDSDFLIGGAPFRADRALLNRRTSEAVGYCPAVSPRPG